MVGVGSRVETAVEFIEEFLESLFEKEVALVPHVVVLGLVLPLYFVHKTLALLAPGHKLFDDALFLGLFSGILVFDDDFKGFLHNFLSASEIFAVDFCRASLSSPPS